MFKFKKKIDFTLVRKEHWKPIPEYEGLYEASCLGNVRNVRTGLVLRPSDDARGYLFVQLYKSGVRKNLKIHRLVAQAFLENTENKPQVNHLNENKTDNRLLNLEWCTALENMNYGTRNARLSKPVLQLALDGTLVRKWDSATQAAREAGFISQAISKCCLGKANTHAGFKWQFDESEEL